MLLRLPHIFQNRKAFTLVELMATILITILLLFMMYMIFKQNTAFWKKSEIHLELFQTARVIIDQMEREIRSGMVGTLEMAEVLYCYGNDSLTTVCDKYLIGSESSIKDEFFFIAASNYEKGESDLCEIGYWVSDNGTPDDFADDILKRHKKGPGSMDFNFTHYLNDNLELQHLGYYVTDLDFEYWTGDGIDNDNDGSVDEEEDNGIDDDGDALIDEDLGGWTDVWDSRLPLSDNQTSASYDDGRFPLRVKIKLTLQDPQKKWQAYSFFTVVEMDK